MPKAKFTSVTGVQVLGPEGLFVIHGRDGAGREVQAELPLSTMKRLAAETKRASLLRPDNSKRPIDAPGDWGEVVPLAVSTAAVGTLAPPAGPAVAVVFDQGRATEMAFRLPPGSARELGEMLVTEGDKLKR